jgi:hypothetical protein
VQKYQYIIILVWELLPDAAEILLYYNSSLGIINRCHGNITILSWYSSNYYQTAWEYYCIIMGIQEKYHKGMGASTIKILNNSNDNNVWYAAFP